MRAVVRPPSESAPNASRIVLGGAVVAFMCVRPAQAAAQDGAARTVALDRTEIERLLDMERPPAALAIVGGSMVDTVASDAAVVRLAPGEYLAARLAELVQPATREGDRLRLPIRYARPDARGAVELRLIPAIEFEPGGLRYAAERQTYEGAFLIGLQDLVEPEARRALSPPIRLRLSAEDGTVSPSAVELTHTNIPFVRVVVRARVPAESLAVRVRPEFDERGVAVHLPVRPPAVAVTPSSARILGFGLETVTITLTTPMAGLTSGATVSVAVDRGTAAPASLVLGHAGDAVFTLRSRGLGPATVTVAGPSILGGTTIVEFVWPVTLLLAALLGAALGVGASAVREPAPSRRRSRLRALGGALALGTVAGLVSAVALAAVANVTPVEIPIRLAEATVLLLATAGAHCGPRSIETARRRSAVPPSGAPW